MTEPYEINKSQASVRVKGVFPGNPPAVRVVYETTNSNGIVRPLVRQFPVRDAELFQRLQSEVGVGDKIEAVVITKWRDDGYDSFLDDFRKIPNIEQEMPSKNGTSDTVQNAQSQVKAAPLHSPGEALAGADPEYSILITPVQGCDVSLGEIHGALNESLKKEATFKQIEKPHFSYGEQASDAEWNTTFLLAETNQWIIEVGVALNALGHAPSASVRFNRIQRLHSVRIPVNTVVCDLARKCKMLIHQGGKFSACPHVAETNANSDAKTEDCTFCSGHPEPVNDQEEKWVVRSGWGKPLNQQSQLILFN